MDAFFAAIEQRDEPSLKGKPVIIGADPKGGLGRGVVSTCSYEARRFGVRSAMPISEAWRRCPQGVYLHPDFHKYEEASAKIRDVFCEFTPDIEQVSIDEAFLDITRSAHLFGGPLETCRRIKARVKEVTGLTCSVGMAPTKMAAKIASDIKKPDGLVEVREAGLRDFLSPLDISRLWGLGPKAAEALRARGINTVGELAAAEADELRGLGRHGMELKALAQGLDPRTLPLATNYPDVISREILGLYAAFGRGRKKVRLLGVKVSGLMAADEKESLFDDPGDARREKAHKAIEQIRGKFGRGSIYRAGGKKEI
jgi:nucleotidyltransferase/DNA polymerase involved in DNA repair